MSKGTAGRGGQDACARPGQLAVRVCLLVAPRLTAGCGGRVPTSLQRPSHHALGQLGVSATLGNQPCSSTYGNKVRGVETGRHMAHT